jgi:hypothetical protein
MGLLDKTLRLLLILIMCSIYLLLGNDRLWQWKQRVIMPALQMPLTTTGTFAKGNFHRSLFS